MASRFPWSNGAEYRLDSDTGSCGFTPWEADIRRAVIVIGSGAAGLAAALAAREAGADVTVLEATSTVGGSSALSSGAIWAPNNHVQAAASPKDSTELARTYLHSLEVGDFAGDLVDQFIDEVPRTLRWLELITPLRLTVLPYPDCHSEFPGAILNGGRSLEPQPIQVASHVAAMVRPPLPWRQPLTLTEMMSGQIIPGIIAERRRAGVVTLGQALIASLLTAVLDAGIAVRTSIRVTRLHQGGIVLDGVVLPGRVVLGTGGFERDIGLVNSFLRAPVRGVIGAPGVRGDGLRMAMSAGAALGNMSEAWWCPTIQVPGDLIDGEPVYRMLFAERARPGAIMVDSRGQRFFDEAQNYNDIGRSLHSFDPGEFRFERDPSWLIFDAHYRDRYPVGPLLPDTPDPDWLFSADTIGGLAELINVSATVLTATIEHFNMGAAIGLDPDFGRGSRAFDGATGDPAAAHPTLRALTAAPYYALRVHPGLGGTKGGPRTDSHGRVQHINGGAIPGLYAAGNAAASPFGFAYPGVGGTLGQALTFGALAGKAAATD